MRKLLLVALLALGPVVAQADNGMFYIGAGLSNDNLRDIEATDSNLNSTNWKVWAGVRPISLFAVEADYMDLGSETVAEPLNFGGGGTTHISYKAFAGYAVGYAPIPVPYLDVFGKVGLARWSSSGSSQGIGPGPGGPGPFLFSLSDNGTQFAWGIGGQLHFGNVGARLEYESFSVRNTGGVNLVSLSVFLNLF
jgi:Outer membrane protein beta-barrel domain